MGAESKAKPSNNNSKKRKPRYLPSNRAVKKKGAYPLRPGVGVEGFFITCDGGRERQASHEAINVIDSFYEELVLGKDSSVKLAVSADKPVNKKTKFSYSDDEDNSGDDDVDEDDEDNDDEDEKSETSKEIGADSESTKDDQRKDDVILNGQKQDSLNDNKLEKSSENQENGADEPPLKKQCLETDALKCGNVACEKKEEKSIDRLIEDELKELGDRNKRRLVNLDSGCNGVVFIQMRKNSEEPGPKDIVQHMMTSAAATRKHISRFILRVLPVEVTCYASEEEITRATKPLIEKYFPVESQPGHKFAVLYEARSNTGIERMKIINAVAKSVPEPHKVDLNNPDRSIVVQIVKTVCLIGIVEKYKELAKYNLRQLTSPKP